jgi:type IV pilus assembly protein PilE
MELLIALAIAAILATLAYPAYQDQVMRARRAEARAALQEVALRQQEFFLNSRSYTTSFGASGISLPTTTDGGFYSLSVANPAGCPIASCYRLEGSPTGVQTNDSCGTLVLTSVGTKLPAGCW